MKQNTIKKSVYYTGIGLHSGSQIKVEFSPAKENTGIVFSIHGEHGTAFIKPSASIVSDTTLATTLECNECSIATVEHLLATIRSFEVDNIIVTVHGKEIPIMDGSAAPLAYLLREAGIQKQAKNRKVYRLKKAFKFELDGKYIEASPSDDLLVDYTIDFAHPCIGKQQYLYEASPAAFEKDIAKARTFGFLEQVEYLRANGLALGGSLESAIVLDKFAVLNAEGLRYKDEFVRHKILDFLGDIAVSSYPIHAKFTVFASGHHINNLFMRALLENADEYLELVELNHKKVNTDAEKKQKNFSGNLASI